MHTCFYCKDKKRLHNSSIRKISKKCKKNKPQNFYSTFFDNFENVRWIN